jgi:hypothetical protein
MGLLIACKTFFECFGIIERISICLKPLASTSQIHVRGPKQVEKFCHFLEKNVKTVLFCSQK